MDKFNIKFDGDHGEKYDLTFPEGFSYLCGDSGTSKSVMCDLIRKGNPTRVYPQRTVLAASLLSSRANSANNIANVVASMFTRKGIIYILDESVVADEAISEAMTNALEKMNSSIVVIGRADIDHVVHGAYNSYELVSSGNVITNRLIFDPGQLPCAITTRVLLTEDRRSSYKVYSKILGNAAANYLYTSRGRTEFLNVLHNLPYSRSEVAGLLDLSGVNGMLPLLAYIDRLCQLVPCECFEELILRSKQLFPHSTHALPKAYNREKWYTLELSKLLREAYAIDYLKSDSRVYDLLAYGIYSRNGSKHSVAGYTRDWDPIRFVSDAHRPRELVLD